ncbi:hypothetical protein [Methylotuvimicrobium sp.]|uniref:hypothetical protein n=1 Tax=Methylotuvimicrobium sp. TaxID=2822413 RepID=UPI003D645A02
MADIVEQAFRTAFQLTDDFEVTDDLVFEGVPGWDSVGHMMLVSELESLIGSTLDMDEIISMDSVKAIRELVATKSQ